MAFSQLDKVNSWSSCVSQPLSVCVYICVHTLKSNWEAYGFLKKEVASREEGKNRKGRGGGDRFEGDAPHWFLRQKIQSKA